VEVESKGVKRDVGDPNVELEEELEAVL